MSSTHAAGVPAALAQSSAYSTEGMDISVPPPIGPAPIARVMVMGPNGRSGTENGPPGVGVMKVCGLQVCADAEFGAATNANANSGTARMAGVRHRVPLKNLLNVYMNFLPNCLFSTDEVRFRAPLPGAPSTKTRCTILKKIYRAVNNG